MIENGESFRHYAKGVESPKGILYLCISYTSADIDACVSFIFPNRRKISMVTTVLLKQ